MIVSPIDVQVRVDTITTWKNFRADVTRARADSLRAVRRFEHALEQLHKAAARRSPSLAAFVDRVNRASDVADAASIHCHEAVERYNAWTDRVVAETGCGQRKLGEPMP